jgi:cell division protein FtsW (lipid II flippase)
MGKITKLLGGAVASLMTASTALGADGSSGFLDTMTNGLDPAIRPLAKLVVDNIPLIFNIVIIGGMMVYAALSVVQRKQGHTQQASEHKVSAQQVFWTGLTTLILVNLWIAASGRFGV